MALLEVEARLIALIQRSKGATVDSVRAFGPLSYDTRNRAVVEASIDLGRKRATFQTPGGTTELPYDFINVVPPMRALYLYPSWTGDPRGKVTVAEAQPLEPGMGASGVVSKGG